MGSNAQQEQTLQQLLTEMDGFEANTGVVIVAASNRPEVLDPALLRPGRFDRQIQVNLPEVKGREEILKIHARNVPLEPGVDLKVLARRTPGFSGAQLANVINEGALLTARYGKDVVGMSELEEAIDRVVAGLERRSQVLTEKERKLVAFHELGHALVAHFVEHADPVHRILIIPRGIGALGYTQQSARRGALPHVRARASRPHRGPSWGPSRKGDCFRLRDNRRTRRSEESDRDSAQDGHGV